MRFSPICCVILALTSLLAGFADDKSSATVDTQAPAAKKKGAETGDSKKQDSKKGDAARLKKAVAENARFLRLRNNDKGDPVAMETSITRYESDRYPGVTVDLIGVVHIADKGYYDKLNKLFEQYDALLYELVAPEGARPIKGQNRQGTSALSGMQRMMKDMLDLQFQLDCIDYQKKNFVHADMSPAEFTKSMNKRGESFSQLFFSHDGPEHGSARRRLNRSAVSIRASFARPIGSFEACDGQAIPADGSHDVRSERTRWHDDHQRAEQEGAGRDA